MFDMYLTSASQSQLDDFCNGALMNSHTLRSSQLVHWQLIGHPHFDGLSLKLMKSCSTNCLKVKGALNESSMLETAVCTQEYCSVIAYILVCNRYQSQHSSHGSGYVFCSHGCCWAKHTIGKSLLVHFRIPGLVHTHPSIFGGKINV